MVPLGFNPDSPEQGRSDGAVSNGDSGGESRRTPPSRRWRRAVAGLVIFGLGLGVGAYLSNPAVQQGLRGWLGRTTSEQGKDVYYCPMHPQYKSDKPGQCPICNMTLVKAEAPGTPEPGGGAATSAQTGERKVLYWVDPMNPEHKSDKPGKAPDGMDLVPVYADIGPGAEGLPPGSVQISPRKQQLVGVQYGEVSEGPVSKTIRAVGRLTYDETRISRIHTKIDGWIEKVYLDFVGKFVGKGDPLITLYSPELVSTQQEFLIAKKARDYLADGPNPQIVANALSLYESARERLRLWDITDEQIREIEEHGAPVRTLTLYSPTSGFVVSRNAFERQRVTPDMELYAIADLSTIWVLADVYEYEVPLIQMGQTAKMTLPYDPQTTFAGKVAYVYPELDKMTRTLKVRLEVPNRGLKLKPDMYANVELEVSYGKQLFVPEEAVLDSGARQIVFVSHDGGYFEPRPVALGPKVDRNYIVLEGLKVGERIVTSGNFLIDSESQLKSALGSMEGMGHGTGAPAPTGGEKPSPPAEPKKPPPGHLHGAR